MDACFDFDITLLCHTILNRKQFERFLWPNLKSVLDTLAAKGKTVRLFMEGSTKRYWEYLKDCPRGMITMHVEQDDVFEMRKELLIPPIPFPVDMPQEQRDAILQKQKEAILDMLMGTLVRQ